MNDKVAKLGTILGVFAHPDDESFLAAGLMAIAGQNGQTVACLTATKGEEGVQNEQKWPKATLGDTRAKELEASLKILGVKNHHWLGYYDGKCNQISDEEGLNQVLYFIEKYQPDSVITFPPNGMTGHTDHKAVSRWSRLAIKQSKKPVQLLYGADTQENYDKYMKAVDEKFNIYFAIDKPVLMPSAKCDLVLKLPADILELKRLSLAAQPSQTEAMYKAFSEDYWLKALSTEAFCRPDPKDPAKWPTK